MPNIKSMGNSNKDSHRQSFGFVTLFPYLFSVALTRAFEENYLYQAGQVTPVAPGVTTGDATTRATLLPGRISFVNTDTSPGKNLYACVVTVATDTTDESGTVYVTLSGDLN